MCLGFGDVRRQLTEPKLEMCAPEILYCLLSNNFPLLHRLCCILMLLLRNISIITCAELNVIQVISFTSLLNRSNNRHVWLSMRCDILRRIVAEHEIGCMWCIGSFALWVNLFRIVLVFVCRCEVAERISEIHIGLPLIDRLHSFTFT